MRPDVIKLDRALVENLHTDPGKLALLESFTTFARRTEAQVCAEGIESDGELDALAELGVDLGQGYRLARPGPPWPSIEREVADWLRLRERPSDASRGDLDRPGATEELGLPLTVGAESPERVT